MVLLLHNKGKNGVEDGIKAKKQSGEYKDIDDINCSILYRF